MIPFKKSKYTKLTVKLLLLFFFLVLLTLALLILSHSMWFSLSLVRLVSNLRVIPKLSQTFLENNPRNVNDFYMEKSEKEPRNLLSAGIHKIQSHYEYIINEPDKCKEHIPFLVLLISVEKWRRKARQAIRDTWGKEDLLPGVKILRLFLLGKDLNLNAGAQELILRESQEYHDIIQQDYLDTYRNLTIKVLMGLKWITAYCPDASYVMKTDHDMFVNTEYLVYKLLKPDQEPRRNYFTGYIMLNIPPMRSPNSKWYVSLDEYPEETYPTFCSGTGYVFSGDLSHKIVKVSPSVRWIHMEDVFIGFCLDELGVQPVAPPKISDFNAWFVGYSDCRYHNLVTSHGVSPRALLYYWGTLQNNKHHCT